MSSRRYNPNRVKIHRNYSARELADRLGVHKNTIRNWQRNGLAPIDTGRPYLFQGAVVRRFLALWNGRHKRPCPAGMLYCFRCRDARRPVPTSIEYTPRRIGAGNLRATCGECGTTMHRRARQEAIHSVLPGMLVQITDGSPPLSGSPSPSPDCDLERHETA